MTVAARILVCLLVLSPALLARAQDARVSGGECLLDAQAAVTYAAVDGVALLEPELAARSVLELDCSGQRVAKLRLGLPLGRSQELVFHSGAVSAQAGDWQLLDSEGDRVAWASFHAGQGVPTRVVLRLDLTGHMQPGQRFSGRIVFGQEGSIPFKLHTGEDSIFRGNFDGLVEPMIGQFSFVH